MGSVVRFVLRLFVVPIGVMAAIIASTLVAGFANWTKLTGLHGANVDDAPALWAVVFLLVTVQAATVAVMLLPGLIGVAVSEALAIRSVIVHAINGGLSIWIGWTTGFGQSETAFDDPKTIVAAGLAGGFAYWAVAGWNAGF